MGLGGLTRDSIIGLNNLVHDDDDTPCHKRRYSGGASGSWNNGSKEGSDEFLFLEDDGAVPDSKGPASFETSLNDGLSSTSSSSPVGISRKNNYSNVSATNSRSLDSYRTDDPVKSASQSAHYQGFQYEGYADYYSDEYANYDDHSYSIGSRGGEKKNVFCCLFAPWAQPKVIEPEDQSVMSGLEEDGDDDKQASVPPAPTEKTESESVATAPSSMNVESTPTLTPTPSLMEKFPAVTSLGVGTMPTVSLTFDDFDEIEPPEARQPKKDILHSSDDPANADKPPTTTHRMLSDESSDSAPTDDTSLSSEEKKEEGDEAPGVNAAREADVQAADEEEKGPAPLEGILKVTRCSLSLANISRRSSAAKPAVKVVASSPTKRHLFPTYEAKKSQTGAEGESKAIIFNPMARVLTIPSRKDIPYHQKARVWWQKCDYDEFKKTGRIISKAMECGGSEIWLASSNAWGNRAAESQRTKLNKESSGKHGDSEEYHKALSKYVREEKKDDDEAGSDEKWWCKFGHSRRGLEHIASSTEGRARQQSVLLAIRMVMEEQKRQRAARTKDPNKLRNIAMQYTSWARDLSLAAGSADAEAVASGFDPGATCRARHFAKRLGAFNENDRAGGGVARAVTSQILDANTHCTPRSAVKKSLKDGAKKMSEDSLSRRAKGFIPGGSKNPAADFLSGIGDMTNRTSLDVSIRV